MTTATIKKVDVYHIIEDIHTDECESVFGWDTVWNPDFRNSIFDDRGIWECPHCGCVKDRDSTAMISKDEYRERYL